MQLGQMSELIGVHDRRVASQRGLSDGELVAAGLPYATATGLIRLGIVDKCPGGMVTNGSFDEAFPLREGRTVFEGRPRRFSGALALRGTFASHADEFYQPIGVVEPTSVTCRLVLSDLEDGTTSDHHLGVVRSPRIEDRRLVNSGLLQSTHGPELPRAEALRLRSVIDEAGLMAGIAPLVPSAR
jgi:hypothetical protein